ncbi:MAG: DNA-methyltransferase [Candidatus Fonsibacter sp.]
MKSKSKLMLGDNMLNLKKLPDNSIDSIVSDPPYGLSFMGKKWDYDVPSVEFWKEVYRVLKPGGHILSFGGTRTYHRMVVNIEDAGFEIRDQVMWLYGSGFPKSHNIGKAVDKIEGNEREVVGDNPNHRKTAGLLELGFQDGKESSTLTKGNSKWEGWGTSLKPANEPICVARKPLSEKTIAENVIKWGTGGINIDGCRVGTEGSTSRSGLSPYNEQGWRVGHSIIKNENEGRFPANIILDETAAELLDEQSGVSKSTGAIRKKDTETDPSSFDLNKKIGNNSNAYAGQVGGASRYFYVAKVSKKERNLGLDGFEEKETNATNQNWRCVKCSKFQLSVNGDICKCDEPEWKAPINKNTHPTLKPINLMTYLCRLITPEGGIVLDPFMGSGSTGISALLEGFRFVGMEMDKDYFKIAEARIENYEEYRKLLK